MQADLRHCWSHIPHCWKSHVTAHMLYVIFQVVGCEKLAGPEEEEIRAGSPTDMEEVLGLSEGNRPALL